MATDMDSRLTALEEEMKSTKIQLEPTLLEHCEHVHQLTNPFTADAKLALAKKVDEKIKEMKKQKAERKKAMKARRA